MSFKEEWAAHKASGAARMQLAHVLPADQATGKASYADDPVLDISTGALRSVARAATAVHKSAKAAVTTLDTAHGGVASGAAGFASTGTLGKVKTSWDERLCAIRERCDKLNDAFSSAAGLHDGNEVDVKQTFESRIASLHGTSSDSPSRER
ncbi:MULTISPECIES: hypothetical protein [Streptomyces]|uniref:hypothetical protein n=1 Tax=Streptomyces TaxID=1883 RepID=UPI00131C7785|nr:MULTISPECIES: hypothetical protein [Streptomyces]